MGKVNLNDTVAFANTLSTFMPSPASNSKVVLTALVGTKGPMIVFFSTNFFTLIPNEIEFFLGTGPTSIKVNWHR